MLTKDQKLVQDDIIDRLQKERFPYYDYPFVIRINGYAGTGKTFLISSLRKEINRAFRPTSIAFCTFTGKASSVVEQKLQENNARFDQDYVGTIHGLIYKPVVKWSKTLKKHVTVGYRLKEVGEVLQALIIIDEASMVSWQIWKDLMTFHIPIIATGDHGQLPPINSKYNLIEEADYTLHEIHRQALNSPIIKIADFARKYGYIPQNRMFSDSVFKLSWGNPECKKLFDDIEPENDVIILCAFNNTRISLNKKIRKKLENKLPEPYIGERVICLRNNKDIGLMNGQLATVRYLMPGEEGCFKLTVETDNPYAIYDCYTSSIKFNDKDIDIFDYMYNNDKIQKIAMAAGFKQLDFFDFGYAISVHKAQGSEWRRVILFEQYCRRWADTWNRWLYTAITRAKEKLFIITDYY